MLTLFFFFLPLIQKASSVEGFFLYFIKGCGRGGRGYRALEREHTNKEETRNELEPATFSRRGELAVSLGLPLERRILLPGHSRAEMAPNSRPALASAHPTVHFPRINQKLHSCTFFISHLLIYPGKKSSLEAPGCEIRCGWIANCLRATGGGV